MNNYFSDVERGPRPRTEEELRPEAWKAVGALIASRIEDGSFGIDFPMACSDGSVLCGCNVRVFINAMLGDLPELAAWHKSVFGSAVYVHNLLGQNHHYEDQQPPKLTVLDLVQFCHRHIGKTQELDYHKYLSHHHFRFERARGQEEFRDSINTIFARNGLVYELQPDGRVVRLAPPVLREALSAVRFVTGDSDLDSLLKDAVRKYSNPDLNVRKEALE
jgi:hypothetical protein